MFRKFYIGKNCDTRIFLFKAFGIFPDISKFEYDYIAIKVLVH